MEMGGGGGDWTGQMIVEVERGKCMGGGNERTSPL